MDVSQSRSNICSAKAIFQMETATPISPGRLYDSSSVGIWSLYWNIDIQIIESTYVALLTTATYFGSNNLAALDPENNAGDMRKYIIIQKVGICAPMTYASVFSPRCTRFILPSGL